MAGPNLPINRTTASTIAEHVNDHNAAHNVVNKFDKDATPSNGDTWTWNGSVYVPTAAGSFNAEAYGLIGDAIELTDVSITSGTNRMTSPSATFTAADLGKVIGIMCAGAAASHLHTAPSGNLRTITAIVNATTVDFNDPLSGTAGTTVVAARTCTASVTRGSNVLTSADAVFTASDQGKWITVPGMTGDDHPRTKTLHGGCTASSTTITATYPVFHSTDIGSWVRLSGAGASGAPHIAKITAVASGVSATIDVAAVATRTSCVIDMLGAPRNIPVRIASVTNATTVTLVRAADFTVTSVTANIGGGHAVYGTPNRDALQTMLDGLPIGATVFVSTGNYLIEKSTITISKPVTFQGESSTNTSFHYAATGSRFVAASDNVRWRDLSFRGMPILSGQAFNTAVTSKYVGWHFEDVTFRGMGVIFSAPPAISTGGVASTTGTGIAGATLERVEITDALNSGLVISGAGISGVIADDLLIHNVGADATSVGLKMSGSTRGVLLNRLIVRRCIADATDAFDSQDVTLNNPILVLNQRGIEAKWSSVGDYHASEHLTIRGGEISYNYAGGLSVGASRSIIDGLRVRSNRNGGISSINDSEDTALGTNRIIYSNLDLTGNGQHGMVLNDGTKYHRLANITARHNGQYGISNNGDDHSFVDCFAFDNVDGGINHTATAQRPEQIGCRTQDTNGQCVITAGAIGVSVNGYGEEAAGVGASPTLANWPVGATVINTSDGSKWRREFAGLAAVVPPDVTIPTGALAQTFPRATTTGDSGAVVVSGTLYLVTIPLLAGQVISTITFTSGTTALSAGTNQWFSLYSAARAKLQVTNDDAATAWGANTMKTLTLASTYLVPTSGLYYLGITVVATTPPTLRAVTTSSRIATPPPILAGASTTALTNPASAPTTAAVITPSGAVPYAYVS